MNGLSYQVLHAKKMEQEQKKFKPIYGSEIYFIDSITKWEKDYEEYLKKLEEQKKNKVKDNEVEIIEEGHNEIKNDSNYNIKRKNHMVLLAQNQEGLYNLFKMISISHQKPYFYRKPRIDMELLKKYNKNIIASSACIGGIYGKCYYQNYNKESDTINEEQFYIDMINVTKDMLNIFQDRWYMELQWNLLPQQHLINKCIIKVSKELNVPVITTVDSHYPRPELWKDRILYNKIGWLGKSEKDKFERLNNPLPSDINDLEYELWVKNGDQVWESYKKYSKQLNQIYDDDFIKETIERTYDIAHNKIEKFY
jgi:DNA polymerase III alpha subunit